MYDIRISNNAKRLLEQHIAFINNVDHSSAIRTKDMILNAIKSLEDMPARCAYFNEPYLVKNKYRKLIVNERYIIIFQIKDKTVYVDYIIDTRQDYQFLLR